MASRRSLPQPLNPERLTHLDAYIRYCARDYYPEPWELRRRRLPDYELILITEGTGEFTSDNQTFPTPPDTLILFKPGIWHSAISVRLPFSFLCVHFEPFIREEGGNFNIRPTYPLKLTPAKLDLPSCLPLRESDDPSFIRLIFTRLVREFAGKAPGYRAGSRGLLTTLLTAVIRAAHRHAKAEAPSDHNDGRSGGLLSAGEAETLPAEIQRVLDAVRTHLHRGISLTDLAEIAHLQPAYLCSLFKKTMGSTIGEYTRLYRISLAKARLLDTDDRISDMALDLGFYDTHHFSRVFRECEGMTPTQYRRMRTS